MLITEDIYIIENWGKRSIISICDKLGYPKKNIQSRAAALGLGSSYNADSIDGIPPTKQTVYWAKSTIPSIIVSEEGDVWDTSKGRTPTLYKSDSGLLGVVVSIDGITYKRSLSKLVYEAFKGPLTEGSKVVHKDGIRTNDDIQNLRRAVVVDIKCVDPIKQKDIVLLTREQILQNRYDDIPQTEIPVKDPIINKAITHVEPIKPTTRIICIYVDGKVAKVYKNAKEYADEKGLKYSAVREYLTYGSKAGKSAIKDDIRFAPADVVFNYLKNKQFESSIRSSRKRKNDLETHREKVRIDPELYRRVRLEEVERLKEEKRKARHEATEKRHEEAKMRNDVAKHARAEEKRIEKEEKQRFKDMTVMLGRKPIRRPMKVKLMTDVKPSTNKHKAVLVYEDGVVVRRYANIAQYAKTTGSNQQSVRNYLDGVFKKSRAIKEDIRYELDQKE